MKLNVSFLCCALARIALGKGTNGPTADDPCGENSDISRWKVNTTEHVELMTPCTVIQHTLWIGNNFPGIFSLPNLVNVSSIYIGDAFYDDQTQSIAPGTLSGVNFPALPKTSEILAVNLGSLSSIDIPNLVDGSFITLTGLPALTNFTLNSNYADGYVNITNTGITEFSYDGPSLSDVTLVGNPSLAKVTISDESAISSIDVDCGGMVQSRNSFGSKYTHHAAQHQMPRFSGPKNVTRFKVSYCKQPSGDWKTALAGIGSIKSYSLKFHDNEFISLSVPDLKNASSIEIEKNHNLTEIQFPSLKTADALTINDNSDLLYINATSFPALTSLGSLSRFDGPFRAITLPPLLSEGYIIIESTSSYFNCTPYDEYSSSIWSTKQRVNFNITVSCTKPYGSGLYSGGSDSDGSSSNGVKIKLKPKIIVAIVVPIISTTFWAIVLWCLCHRRSKRRAKQKAEMAALQSQIQGLAQPIQQLANGQQRMGPSHLAPAPPHQNGHLSMNSQPRVSPVSAVSEVAHLPKTTTVTTSPLPQHENLYQPVREPTPVSTILSREEFLDARERALQERERRLEQDVLDARERVLLAREQEIASLEDSRRT